MDTNTDQNQHDTVEQETYNDVHADTYEQDNQSDNDGARSQLSPEDALKELEKARKEAAKYRVERNQLRDAAAKWQEYEESQKTELEKAQERAAQLDAELAQTRQHAQVIEIANRYGIKADDVSLLGAGDVEQIEANAKRLAALYEATDAPTPPPSQRPRESLRSGTGVTPTGTATPEYPAGWVPKALRDN